MSTPQVPQQVPQQVFPFEKILVDLLAKAEMTPVELADMIGVTPTTVGNWLLGSNYPRRSAMKAMSIVLNHPDMANW